MMSVRPHPRLLAAPDDRVSPETVTAARTLSAASLHEAGGRIGALPREIHPIHPQFRICGPALTVHSPGGDNLWLHRALYAAAPGDVLVVHCAGRYDHGYWGDVMASAAKIRGLGGLVIDGCVRDFAMLGEIGFPVFARGLCIRGTGKDQEAIGWINAPIWMGDVAVHAGDLVFGDNDGVVVLPKADAARIVAAAAARDSDEDLITRRLEAGETTLDIYRLD
jgi:4-hydroxy-4-methyl-2-oxoglutarate aldolase